METTPMEILVTNRIVQAILEGENSIILYGNLYTHGLDYGDFTGCMIEEEVEDDLIYTVISWDKNNVPF